MRARILAALLAALGILGIGLATAPTASAHTCDSRCNKIWNVGGDGSGDWIFDQWDGNVNHKSFLLPYGAWSTTHTPDVDGAYVAPGWCLKIYQSNNGSTWAFYGYFCADPGTGQRYFPTTYWLESQIGSYREPRCDVDC